MAEAQPLGHTGGKASLIFRSGIANSTRQSAACQEWRKRQMMKTISDLQPGDVVGEDGDPWYTVTGAVDRESVTGELRVPIQYPDGGHSIRVFFGDSEVPVLP